MYPMTIGRGFMDDKDASRTIRTGFTVMVTGEAR